MQIQTRITQRDRVEFHRFQLARDRKGLGRRLVLALLPPLAATATICWLIAHRQAGPAPLSWFLAACSLLPVYLGFFYAAANRSLKRQAARVAGAGENEKDPSAPGEWLIALAEDGLTASHDGQSHFRPWEQILRVIADGDYCYIHIEREKAIIVPRHCFADDGTFRAFARLAVIYHYHREQMNAGESLGSAAPQEEVVCDA